jgi:hypothetical protein
VQGFSAALKDKFYGMQHNLNIQDKCRALIIKATVKHLLCKTNNCKLASNLLLNKAASHLALPGAVCKQTV